MPIGHFQETQFIPPLSAREQTESTSRMNPSTRPLPDTPMKRPGRIKLHIYLLY